MTVISEDVIGEFRRITIENGIVCARFLPELGAKITSLVRVASAHEFLLQPQRSLRRASYGSAFADFDTSGFDECVPTVSACRLRSGQELPDHGELWSVAWDPEILGDRVRFSVGGRAMPYRFVKTIRLESSEVVIDYELVNNSGDTVKFLWSAHPLLAIEPGSRIMLPADVKELLVDYSFGDRQGHSGETCQWPVKTGAGRSERLDVLQPPTVRFADKLFTPRVKDGFCALIKPESNESIVFRFDPAITPYIGVWICQGGWPDTSHGHYTVGLEPCSGRPDSLTDAIARGENDAIAPRSTKRWTVRIQLQPADNIGELC